MPQVAYVEFTYLKKKKTTVMDFFPLNQSISCLAIYRQ